MAGILVNHTVENYDKWLKHYENHEPKRREGSVKNSLVWQAADNPNNVYILMEYDDEKKIKQFVESADLKQVMQEAGVIGKPTITYVGKIRWPQAARGAMG